MAVADCLTVPLRRLLRSAERLSEAAIVAGVPEVNIRFSTSSASLRSVTLADHLRRDRVAAERFPGCRREAVVRFAAPDVFPFAEDLFSISSARHQHHTYRFLATGLHTVDDYPQNHRHPVFILPGILYSCYLLRDPIAICTPPRSTA